MDKRRYAKRWMKLSGNVMKEIKVMEKKIKRACGKCRFSTTQYADYYTNRNVCECRFNPPSFSYDAQNGRNFVFPEMDCASWCYQFQPKQETGE